MRRNREPGTRKPRSWPESKQRMIVCWLTLQILAASPVVNTVFMVVYAPSRERLGSVAPEAPPAGPSHRGRCAGCPVILRNDPAPAGHATTPRALGGGRRQLENCI